MCNKEILKYTEEYIIRFKNLQVYVEDIELDNIQYTFQIENAKRYKRSENIINQGNEELEIVSYNKELYRSKCKGYKMFIDILSSSKKAEISDKDIEIYREEIKKYGKYIAYINLSEKYPQNLLVGEIERIIEKIEFRKNCKGTPEKHKCFKDITKIYDYDDKRQLQILELAFKSKYIKILNDKL